VTLPGGVGNLRFMMLIPVISKLASNTDLYEYLLSLGDLPAGCGSQQLAETVRFAAKQGTGLSSEFLGESRIALRATIHADTELMTATDP
jgi:hypothetical protein